MGSATVTIPTLSALARDPAIVAELVEFIDMLSLLPCSFNRFFNICLLRIECMFGPPLGAAIVANGFFVVTDWEYFFPLQSILTQSFECVCLRLATLDFKSLLKIT